LRAFKARRSIGTAWADELFIELGAQDNDGVPERLLVWITRGPPELVAVGDGVADAGGVTLRLVGVAAADRGGEEPMELIAEA
jgi:hypothetical protein